MSLAEAAAIGSTAWYDALRARSTPVLRRIREEASGESGYVGPDSVMAACESLALAPAAPTASRPLPRASHEQHPN